ncbi:MAG: RHS repeat-associated core domain-containing protein, partial [Fimbriimonas sp.]
SYGYDAAGRTTSVVSSAGTTTLSYDYEGRVTGITYPGSSTNSFTYNGMNARVSKVDSSGTKTYLHDGVSVTSPVVRDGSSVYTPGISQRTSGVSTFEMLNHLGTSTLQTDAARNTTATRTYDAFGMATATTGIPKGPFGYAGEHGYQEDADSSLKLLGHRYYDPSTGRFLTRDPLKAGRNWYAYCDNNPVQRADPSGLDWHDPAQVHVDPAFGGKVWVVGELYPGGPQVMRPVPAGGSSPPGMDVDLVIVQYPGGGQRRYMLPGNNTPQDPQTVTSNYEVGPTGEVTAGIGGITWVTIPGTWISKPKRIPIYVPPGSPIEFGKPGSGKWPGNYPPGMGGATGNWNDDIEAAKKNG